MKWFAKILFFSVLFLICTAFRIIDEYDIKGFYSAIDTESGTKALTSDGSLAEISQILVPTKLKEGKYAVSVSRKAKDLYKVDGKDIYIETRFCFEFATGEDVILIVESNVGFSKGKIIF
jgi:hypothetical protein